MGLIGQIFSLKLYSFKLTKISSDPYLSDPANTQANKHNLFSHGSNISFSLKGFMTPHLLLVELTMAMGWFVASFTTRMFSWNQEEHRMKRSDWLGVKRRAQLWSLRSFTDAGGSHTCLGAAVYTIQAQLIWNFILVNTSDGQIKPHEGSHSHLVSLC